MARRCEPERERARELFRRESRLAGVGSCGVSVGESTMIVVMGVFEVVYLIVRVV